MLTPALDATRLQDGEHLEHVGAARTWAVAAIATPDRMCNARLAVTDEALVVANGPFLAADGDQQRALTDLLERFQTSGSAAVTTGLGGSYNFVGIAPSIGVRASRTSPACVRSTGTRATTSPFSPTGPPRSTGCSSSVGICGRSPG